METQANLLLGFLPMIILMVGYIVPIYLLAKEKGRNTKLWLILALIPGINLVSMVYIVGAPSRNIERKLDELLQRLNT